VDRVVCDEPRPDLIRRSVDVDRARALHPAVGVSSSPGRAPIRRAKSAVPATVSAPPAQRRGFVAADCRHADTGCISRCSPRVCPSGSRLNTTRMPPMPN
jgi:hypothetical protein